MNSLAYIQRDAYAANLGVECIESSFENTVCRLVIQNNHLNGLGTTHGAVIFSLADIAFACACNASEQTFVGVQTEIRYMRKAQGNELIAYAMLVSASKRFAHYQVTVKDGQDNQIALFTGTACLLQS
ncbi:PaaI family thioesterase [Halioxenophilus aromaticivorans]|uniref:Hotdog fold thioesterase n=1 Tax=Halioxenophilus aromaticivorans TaxID=1306992 RepID=A0AAV3U7C7_9ALTE